MSVEDKQMVEPEKIASELGSFSPPADFSFGPEFGPATPRPIPRELRQGSYEMKWRQGVYVAFGVALFFVMISHFDFVEKLSYYILPLGYLDWIAYGILAICAIVALCHIFLPCRYVYIRDGKPLAVRVLRTGFGVDKSSGVNEFCFSTQVDFVHPETNKICYSTISSDKFSTIHKIESYSTTLEKGDYITAVYLPGKFEKSLRIYGYLGLNADVDFIRRDGRRITEHASLWKTLAVIGLIVGVLTLGIAAMYTMDFFWPIEFNVKVFMIGLAAGGLILGVTSLITALILNKLKQKSIKVAKCFIFSALAGVFLSVFLLPVVNSVFDHSESEFREVEVVNLWQTTWDYLIRNYEIEYRELKSGKQRKYPATLEHMQYFFGPGAGAIEVKQGFLGWSWVRQIHPAVVIKAVQEDGSESDLQQPVLEKEKAVDEGSEFKVFILVDGERLLPISERMQNIVLQKLQEDEGPVGSDAQGK